MNIDIESIEFKRHQRSVQAELADMLEQVKTQSLNGIQKAIFLPLAHYNNSCLANLAPEGTYLNFEQNQSLEAPFKIAGAIYIGAPEFFDMQRFNDIGIIPQSPEKQTMSHFLWKQKTPDLQKQFLKKNLPFNKQKDIHKITRSLHRIFKNAIRTNQENSMIDFQDQSVIDTLSYEIVMTDLPMLSYSIHSLINHVFEQDEAQSDWPNTMYKMSHHGDFSLQIDIGKKSPKVNTIVVIQGARFWNENLFNFEANTQVLAKDKEKPVLAEEA